MSLQITYDRLRREVGRYLGFDRDPDEWDATQALDVADIIQSGLRSFYWPVSPEGRYTWSFLRKQGTITTVSGTWNYALPDDFEGSMSGLTGGGRRIKRVPEEELVSIVGQNNKSGRPEFGAIRAVQPSEGDRMRYEVLLYPVPDAAYEFTYRYSISPSELSELNQLHLGGSAHSECVLEACLAAAEKVLRPEQGPGVHAALFQQLLQGAMQIDREMQ